MEHVMTRIEIREDYDDKKKNRARCMDKNGFASFFPRQVHMVIWQLFAWFSLLDAYHMILADRNH